LAEDHRGPDHDGILIARISGIARRYARWGGLTGAEEAAGAAELREVAAGRTDLLAEEAGIEARFFVALLGWLLAETRDGSVLGLAERLTSSIQTCWPFTVAVALRRSTATSIRRT
jgi:hypothetical protein